MKKLVREFHASPEQLQTAEELAARLGLTQTTAGILVARGVDTEEKARVFLHPSASNFLSPFLMKGMREAAELIRRARDEGWRVAVFGDYDADGIGACAVLSRALARFGIEPYLYVPERTDGYGMSVAAVDAIFDEFLPDLIITVDCGISNRKEVEYIQSLGAYCIVTDHHELPDELPDCIVVNPKLKDDYPYDNLCGAGVALKLAQALIGESANALCDFVALSTVADSVPLTGENRDIVAEGLRLFRSPRPAFAALLGKTSEVTAQTLAFTIAPRVNAAGRMGDARAALDLFTSDDPEEIAALAARLNAYNLERQKCCDELYAQAYAKTMEEGAYGNVVMLADKDWNAGFVGIVAARIAEEFSRPALLFVERGGMLKGSARSIENINIFDALKHCAEHIEEFGGHAQAAGVNVSKEKFGALKDALDAYIGARYKREDFVREIAVAGEGISDPQRVARELELLEPCGMGNRRPLFAVRAGKLDASPMKPFSPHLCMSTGGMDLVYFNGVKDAEILQSDLEKQIVFEYNLSTFRGKETVKGFVRCVLYDGDSGTETRLDGFARLVQSLGGTPAARPLSEEEADALLRETLQKCPYGLCAVAYDRETVARFPALKGMPIDVYRPSCGGTANTLLFAPDLGCDLGAYRDVVLLDGAGAVRTRGNVYACGTRKEIFARVDTARESLLGVFAALKARDGAAVGGGYAAAARSLGLAFPPEQTVFALAVFEELGLIALGERLRVIRGKKSDLAQSRIYGAVRRLKEEG